ncbi:recE, partial [Mycobacteroides abscessus subsp. massiliense]
MSDQIPAEDGMYSGIPDEVYHGDRTSLSSSGARALLAPSCPEIFRHQQLEPPAPKPQYDFGHVAHKFVLGEGSEIAELDPAIHGLNKDGSPS